MTFNKLLLPTLMSITFLAGCQAMPTHNDPNRQTKIGATVGAVIGGVAGYSKDKKGKHALLGALLGGVAGGLAGKYLDDQQRAFEDKLAAERRSHQIEIDRLNDKLLKLTLDASVSFDVGKADIKPMFRRSLDKVASVMVDYPKTIIDIVGHTDSTGSEDYNMQLSRQRADNVVDYLAQRGVDYRRLTAMAAGETSPIANNNTAEGRRQNRRVEIFVAPIIDAS